MALVPFPIPSWPTNPLSAFPACRECSELIRSMIISRLGGHDRSLSQQLCELPDLSTLAENLMLRNIALVPLLSLSRSLWGFQLIFLSLSFRLWRVQHQRRKKRQSSMQLPRGCWLKLRLPPNRCWFDWCSSFIREKISIKVSAALSGWLHHAEFLHWNFKLSEVRACTAARQQERAGGREAGVPAWNLLWRDSGFKQLLLNGCSYFRFGGSLKLEQKIISETCRGVRREDERRVRFPPLCLVHLFEEAPQLKSKSTSQ